MPELPSTSDRQAVPDRSQTLPRALPALPALPAQDSCSTAPIGSIQSFGTCLVDGPITCRHVMGYGNGYLCRHPDWKAWIQPLT